MTRGRPGFYQNSKGTCTEDELWQLVMQSSSVEVHRKIRRKFAIEKNVCTTFITVQFTGESNQLITNEVKWRIFHFESS